MIVCITEKPSVAESIAKVLGANLKQEGYWEGNNYQITWAFGHLCELKEPYEYNSKFYKWELNSLPILPDKFGIRIKNDSGIKEQFNIIKNLCKKAEYIINCGDAGQEGEVIQRWIYQLIGINCPIKRLWVSSLTEEAIKEGFNNLKDNLEYQSLYKAGVCRAIGDWLLGLNMTRLYTLKYGGEEKNKIISIGRVQTPTLAMIVKRQKEIDNFISEPYWILQTSYKNVNFQSTKGKFVLKEEGEKYFKQIENLPFIIKNILEKKGKELPPQLFDLTTLQFECNKNFGFSAEYTLQIAQKLYEKKLITYPRVDTRYLTEDMYFKCKDIIDGIVGYSIFKEKILNKELSKDKRFFDNKKVTDHHAIIPTGIPLFDVSHDEYLTYDLIVRSFLSIFLGDCLFEQSSIIGNVGNVEFKANQKIINNLGWREIYQQTLYQDEDKNKEEIISFEIGESGSHKPSLLEKKTTPPKFYNDGTLVKAMETAGQFVEDENLREALKENGIGRPSSRGSIIETLFKRQYLKREKGNILPTQLGIDLIELIDEELLKSPKLTGIWEKKLRDIEMDKYDANLFIQELKEQVKNICNNINKNVI